MRGKERERERECSARDRERRSRRDGELFPRLVAGGRGQMRCQSLEGSRDRECGGMGVGWGATGMQNEALVASSTPFTGEAKPPDLVCAALYQTPRSM